MLAGTCAGAAQNSIVPVRLVRNNDIVWGQALGLCSYEQTFSLRPQVCPTEHFHHTTLRFDPHNVPEFLSRLDIDCLCCRGGDRNYIQSQALGGLSWRAHVPWAPRGKEFHLSCNPFKEL